MSTWYYYDNNGQKQGPVTGGQLKGLARAGRITPETVVENEEGKSVPARKIQGLTFAEAMQSEIKPSAEPNTYATTPPTSYGNTQSAGANYFYTDANGYKYGPVNEQQLRVLAAQGGILPTTPLETDTGYKGVAGQIPGLNFHAAAFGSPMPNTTYSQQTPQTNSENIDTPIAGLVESGLRSCSFFDNSPGTFATYQRSLSLLLTWVVLVGCLSSALFFVVISIKSDTLSSLWMAAGLVLAGVVLHFLCSRFAYAGTCLVMTTPCRMSTGGLTESLGLFALLLAVTGLCGGVYIGIKEGGMEGMYSALSGVAIFVFCGFLMLCLLSPRACLNLQFDEEGGTSAGETAISFCIVILRLLLLSVPTVAALLALGGTGTSLWACLKLLGASQEDPFAIFSTIAQGTTATGLVITAGILPLLMYIYYLLGVLSAELCRSIFEIARNTRDSEV